MGRRLCGESVPEVGMAPACAAGGGWGRRSFARVSDCGNAEFAGQFPDVRAEPVRVRRGVLRLEDAGVDAASQMFHSERRIDGDFAGGLAVLTVSPLLRNLQRYRMQILGAVCVRVKEFGGGENFNPRIGVDGKNK